MIYKKYFFNESLGDKIIEKAWSLGIKFTLLSVGSKGQKQSYRLKFKSEFQLQRFNRLVKLFFYKNK